MESWVGERLSLEMYGKLGRGMTVTRNVWTDDCH